MLSESEEDLTRKLIEQALAGDPTALSMAMARILPPAKERLEGFRIGPTKTPADVSKAQDRLIRATAAGDLSLSAAGEACKLLESKIRMIEVAELQVRLDAVEERLRLTDADKK